MGTKKCAQCGKEFRPKVGNQKYCSAKCAKEAFVKSESFAKYHNKRARTVAHINPDLVAAFGFRCAICGWSIPSWRKGYAKYERNHGCQFHHIVPISEGGTSDEENLILLCPNCHKKAHSGLITTEELKRHTFTKEEAREIADAWREEMVWYIK